MSKAADWILPDQQDGPTKKMQLGLFLAQRLKEAGCDHIFGVPGDFVLGLLNEVLKSDLEYVGTCNELNAAYAADGYARIKGLGALITTYAVGELSAFNGVAGAFAESVPIVKIAGVPATDAFKRQPLLHHTLGDYMVPYKCYEQITVAQTILTRTETAAAEIDRVLRACLRKQKPVYIGVPSDMVLKEITVPITPFQMPRKPQSNKDALEEAITETLRLLQQSHLPLLIPGIEVSRRGLKAEFEALVKASGLPFTAMMLSKAIVDEDHPQYIGLYSGNRSRKYVRERVEKSDCILIFGEKLTDFNTGGFTAALDRRTCIEIGFRSIRIMFHTYEDVYIHDFLPELASRIPFRDPSNLEIKPAVEGCIHRRHEQYVPEPERTLTMARLFDRIAHYLEPGSIVLAETGASLFSATEVLMPNNTIFIGQTFYGSIGFSVGATLGACIAAAESKRQVYLFVGDGSFQVTCQDLSTMIRYNCTPKIFLINNDGYTVERVIVDHSYNDIQPWKYAKLPVIFGGREGFEVRTEKDLEDALNKADSSSLQFLEIFLDRWDCSGALWHAGFAMATTNNLLTADEIVQRRELLSKITEIVAVPCSSTVSLEVDEDDDETRRMPNGTRVLPKPSH